MLQLPRPVRLAPATLTARETLERTTCRARCAGRPRRPVGAARYDGPWRSCEATMVREALARFGPRVRAAHHLGVGQAAVARKARRYGLTY